MSNQYCPECGNPNPGRARFCMDCGTPLDHPDTLRGAPAPGGVDSYVPPPPAPDGDTDWGANLGAIVAAVLAFLSLRHVSRHARQTIILVAFLFFFFGCPMICGFVAFVMQWFAGLFQ